ncbi:MAG: rhodanese-related sulfurtransferase [Bacteriovoracaceae bacterium]|jgi:rhodanese-related sulfurtransferase
MKQFLLLITLIFSPLTFSGEIAQINVQELKNRLELADKNIVILDIRTPYEHKSGIIKGAIKKNAYNDDFEKYVKALDKKKTYLIYCHSGGRSYKATDLFTRHGLKAFNVKGGISAWKDQGFKTVK